MTAAVSAASFIASLGVNTHLDFGGTYANVTQVEQNLEYLGLVNVRDSASNSSDAQLWQQAAQATGVKFDAYIGETSPAGMSAELQLLPQLAQEGILNFIEGGNEEDDSYPVSLGNNQYTTAQFQQQVWAEGQQLGLPVINMSFGAGWTSANDWQGDYGTVGDLSAYATYANAHTYPAGGANQPDETISRLNGLAQMAASSRPVITTEIGWDNANITQPAAAKYVLDATFDGIKDGDAKLYFYALYDDGSGQFGLMNADGTPKPAGQALHNLTTLMADQNGAGFTTGSLAYSLSGTQSGDNQLLMQKSDGSYWLALWDETDAAHTVTVSLPANANVTEYDPLTGASAVQIWSDASSVQVTVPDHPVLLEIAQPAPTPTPTPVTTQTSPSDTVITVPASETVQAGSTTTIQGVSVSDPWAAANPGTMALNIWDQAGTLELGGQTFGPGGGEVPNGMFQGSLAQINADLASLQYMAGSAGADTITVDIWNQAGAETKQTLAVDVKATPTPTPAPTAYDVTLDPSNTNPVITTSNVSIYGDGSFSLFIGGSHDTALLVAGNETVQAYQGYNTITTGTGNDTIRYAGTGNAINAGAGSNLLADSGSGNTLVMPAAGQGFDDVYGYVFQNNDTLDLRHLLADTSWDGTQGSLGQYLSVGMTRANAELYARNTPTGSFQPAATFEGSGQMGLSTLLAHSIT